MSSRHQILKEYSINLMNIMNLLGSGVTDNSQLDILGNCLFSTRYKGTFPSNETPKLNNSEMCIINTDDKKGVHWCALYKYKNKNYFYDSYNRNFKSFKNWKNKNWINANKDVDQAYNGESNCGQRSICSLISFDKHKDKIINII